MCEPSGSSPPQGCLCCVMIRSNSLMEQVLTLSALIRTKQNQRVRMGKNPNGKRSRKTSNRTRRKRWKRRKNRCKRAHHPNARFLERWFPSIPNDGRKVPSPRWNVLTVEERVHSLRSRASSGSHRTSHAKSRPKFMANVGRHQEKRTGKSLEEGKTNETKDAEPYSCVWTGHYHNFSRKMVLSIFLSRPSCQQEPAWIWSSMKR